MIVDVLRGGPRDGLRLTVPDGITRISFPAYGNGLVTYVPHPSVDHVWICDTKTYRETAVLPPEETA